MIKNVLETEDFLSILMLVYFNYGRGGKWYIFWIRNYIMYARIKCNKSAMTQVRIVTNSHEQSQIVAYSSSILSTVL